MFIVRFKISLVFHCSGVYEQVKNHGEVTKLNRVCLNGEVTSLTWNAERYQLKLIWLLTVTL